MTSDRDRVRAAFDAGAPSIIIDEAASSATLVVPAHSASEFTIERLGWMTNARPRVILDWPHWHRLGLEPGTSVNAVRGIGNGTSAADIARTIRVLAAADRRQIVTPGQVGVLAPDGSVVHELALSLASGTGHPGAVVLAEMLDGDGSAVLPHLMRLDPWIARTPTLTVEPRAVVVTG